MSNHFLYGAAKKAKDTKFGLTREEWVELLKIAVSLGVSALLSFLIQKKIMEVLSGSSLKNQQMKEILSQIAKHLKIKSPKQAEKKLKLTAAEWKLAGDILFAKSRKDIKGQFADLGGLEDEIKRIKSAVIDPLSYQQRLSEKILEYKKVEKNSKSSKSSKNQQNQNLHTNKIKELTSVLKQYECAKGVLLYGPPGCGKTQMVKSLAAESGIPVILTDSSKLLSKWHGESNKNVDALWTLAFKIAPCIIFLDEVDSFLGDRDGDRQSAMNTELVSLFLSRWDGFKVKARPDGTQNSVIFIGATNRKPALDPAIMRRFTTKIEIKQPCRAQLKAILQVHLDSYDTSNISVNEWDELAALCHTYKFTGADCKLVASRSSTLRIDDFVKSLDKKSVQEMMESNSDSNDVSESCSEKSLPVSEPEFGLIDFSHLKDCIAQVKRDKAEGFSDDARNMYC